MDRIVRYTAVCRPVLLCALVTSCDESALSTAPDSGVGSTTAASSTTAQTGAGTGDPDADITTGPPSTGDASTSGTTSFDDETTTTTGTRGMATDESSSDSGTDGTSDGTTSGETGTDSTGTDSTGTDGTGTDGTGSDSTTSDETTTEGAASTVGEDDPCVFSEDFEGYEDGAPWPAGWTEGGGVELASIEGGWGRLRPVLTDYSLGRMVFDLGCAEPDVSLTFMFTVPEAQGIGLYSRHNGGYLVETMPPGRGYSAFAESFRDPHGLGVWREVGGIEQQLAHLPTSVEAGVEYRLRYRVTQLDSATSLLQAKIWPVGEPESPAWMIEATDGAFSLQNFAGSLAIDAWVSEEFNGAIAPDLLIDDIVVVPAL